MRASVSNSACLSFLAIRRLRAKNGDGLFLIKWGDILYGGNKNYCVRGDESRSVPKERFKERRVFYSLPFWYNYQFTCVGNSYSVDSYSMQAWELLFSKLEFFFFFRTDHAETFSPKFSSAWYLRKKAQTNERVVGFWFLKTVTRSPPLHSNCEDGGGKVCFAFCWRIRPRKLRWHL